MEKVGDILNQNYGKKAHLTREQLLSIRVCGVWERVMAAIDTKYVAESRAVKFKYGELMVAVTTSGYLMELEMLKLIIIEKYGEVLGMDAVREIRFRLG